MRRPAVLFDARKGAFRCPCCGEIIELPSSDDTDGWTAAKPEAFRMENLRNHQCMNCESPLWTAVNPSVPSPWVKIPEYGWVHRKLAVHAMQKTKNPAAPEDYDTRIKAIEQEITEKKIIMKEIALYQEKADYLIHSGSRSPAVMERWVNKNATLEQKKLHYEEILRRELDGLDDEFETLRLLSQELSVRANGLRFRKAA